MPFVPTPSDDRVAARRTGPLVILGAATALILGLSTVLMAAGWKTTRWTVKCVDPPECAPSDEMYKEDLEAVSRWLEGLGFKAPVIKYRIPDQAYQARVSDAENSDQDGETYGFYDSNNKLIYLKSDLYSATGNEDTAKPNIASTLTPAHELFHAVESAYHPGIPDEQNWIWEGMADAVMRAYADEKTPGHGGKMSTRKFDDPLHYPGRRNSNPDNNEDYGTWFFWLETGRQIKSPSGIGYLHGVLEHKLTAGRGLEAVDQALSPWQGLYDLLPQFFTILEPGQKFRNIIQHKAVLPKGKRESTTKIRGDVDMVAGRAVDLEIKESTNNPVEVEIRFKEDSPDLHLLVDQNRFDTDRTGPRNIYRGLFLEDEATNLHVIVANVAEKAIKTRDHRPFELEVTLREVGYCSMSASFSGDLTGYVFGDVAHFSTKGGATTYGAFANPEFVGEMMEGMGEFMAAQTDEENGEAIREGMAELRRESEAQAGQIPREALGLSLGDLKLEGEEGDAAGLAFLTGGFTLQLSVLGAPLPKGFTGSLKPAMVHVMPGPRAEANLDKVAFTWAQGEPGAASLTITYNQGGVMAGTLQASLEAEGFVKDDGSKPVINVTAQFIANEGPLGCMTPF